MKTTDIVILSIVVLALPIQMHREREILAGLEQVQLFFQQQRVGAQVDVLPARHQPSHNLRHPRVQQRFPAGNGEVASTILKRRYAWPARANGERDRR